MGRLYPVSSGSSELECDDGCGWRGESEPEAADESATPNASRGVLAGSELVEAGDMPSTDAAPQHASLAAD